MPGKFSMLPGLTHATRLVRCGDLMQAVAVIQEGLNGREPPFDASATRSAPVPDSPTTPGAGSFEWHAFSNAAGTRNYKLHVPAGHADGPMPLVVMLHGCTQSPDDFAAGTRMNELAAELGFLVAYPEQPAGANPNKCWNWFKGSEQGRERGEPSIVAGIVGAIRSGHAIDERRIFVAGLSSGGAMAATLAATYPELFAAVGVHSGLPHGCAHDLPSALAAMRAGGRGAPVPPARAIVFHGDRDSLVHPRNGAELFDRWKPVQPDVAVQLHASPDDNGYAYTRRSIEDEFGRPALEHWVIHGAGHAWSGGSATGTHTDARGPDASREMVRFFLSPGCCGS